MTSTRVDQSVDISGLICPYTLIQTRDALKKMEKGQVLEVSCDYEPAALTTIPNFCEKKGYPLETTQDSPGVWKLRIEKTD